MFTDYLFPAFWIDGTFERPFPEVERFKTYTQGDGSDVLVLNTLGIAEKDLSLDIADGKLLVKGSTKNPFTEETSSIDYKIRLRDVASIESIKYECIDGYTYIHLFYTKTKKPVISKLKK